MILNYTSFILEYSKGTRTEKIDMDQIVKLFMENCSDWDFKTELWRGSNSHSLFYIDPKKNHGHRFSANTDNQFYQNMFLMVDSWEKAPKRTESLIMTSNKYTASTYGDVYLMIPFNGVNLGICPCDDLWCSMKYIDEIIGEDYSLSLNDLNYEVQDFLESNLPEKYLDKGTLKEEISYDNIKFYFSEIDKIPKHDLNLVYSLGNYNYILMSKWVENYSHLKLFDFFEMVFNFDKNGFIVSTDPKDIDINREVWSDGEFLGIEENLVDEFKKRIKIERNKEL